MSPAEVAVALALPGDGSFALKIVILAVIVAAILFTRFGPRDR
jgi:hypothetical protein